MDWTVSEGETEGALRVRVVGDCDLYAAPRFAADMLGRIGAGARRLSLDLSGVEYLDSTGVGAIIRILQEARKTGTWLGFSGIAGSPRKVLRMTNILALLREEDAPKGAL